VRLLGADDWLQGKVQQTRGSAARNDERLLAAQIPNPGARQISVEIALPPDNARRDGTAFCDIGRLAEVRFERTGLGVGVGIGAAWHRLVEFVGLRATHVADGSRGLVR
jgi:hypothetical protein